MKKIIICLLACLSLNACVKAGDFDLLPFRKKIVKQFRGYAIDFYDNEKKLVGEENVRENNYVMNKAITVKKGEDILSDKLVSKKTYQTFVAKFNKKGNINSNVYPMNVTSTDEYKIIGHTIIDGVEYTIIESPLDDFVFLFDKNGNLYEKTAKIDGNRLNVLDSQVFAYPSDLKLSIIAKMHDEISKVKEGYQIKYGGTKLERLFFDYLVFDNEADAKELERLSFPNKSGLIVINGIGLRILNATDDAVTYMILVDNM